MADLQETWRLILWGVVFQTGLRVLFILFLAWIARLVLKKILSALEDRLVSREVDSGEPLAESARRIQTLVGLVRQAIMLTLWGVVGLILLDQLGVQIGPILAGAGILGLAVGFGAQNLVRDVISGFFLILEDQVRVGDVAVINGTGGTVERIGFRILVLRDMAGTVHVFPNGTITTLSNMSHTWSAYVFEIGVAYKENTDHVVQVLESVFADLEADPVWKGRLKDAPEIFGVERFDDSAVIVKGRLKTRPMRQWAVGREFLRRVKLAFDREGIEIPFPHRSVFSHPAPLPQEKVTPSSCNPQDAE